MGLKVAICLLLPAVLIGLVALLLHIPIASMPSSEEKYWGPGDPPKTKENTKIIPMKVEFSEEVIKDLKHRLSNTYLQPPMEGVAQEYGMNSNALKEIINHWQTKYPFKEREAYLNKYPHFKTKIQGLDIHFIHAKPKPIKGVTILPLMLLHGWPDSFRAFLELIPILTTKNPNYNFMFEIIIPSLPGYGYSQTAAKPGLGAAEMAPIMKNLMLRLGHEKFYIHGQDWGSVVAAFGAIFYKNRVLGFHCSMCFDPHPISLIQRFVLGAIYPSAFVEDKYADRMYPNSYYLTKIVFGETGYYHLQATKPDTLGVALGDSPAGLAGYMLEKFSSGTNLTWQHRTDGGFKDAFKYDDLLDNVMVFWVTKSITSSMRLYAESLYVLNASPIEVPTACTQFRYEIFYAPEHILRRRYRNLVQNNHYDTGGHFADLQLPNVVAADILSAVDKMIQHHHKQK